MKFLIWLAIILGISGVISYGLAALTPLSYAHAESYVYAGVIGILLGELLETKGFDRWGNER